MYEQLKLSNQLCFPLYVCSKEIVRKYKPYLDEIDITYTQYITMMVFWEKKEITMKELGKLLFLDSGTLTPVVKTLESKGYLTRQRSKDDERNLSIKITQSGEDLQEKCKTIPEKMGRCIELSKEEAELLHKILLKLEEQF